MASKIEKFGIPVSPVGAPESKSGSAASKSGGAGGLPFATRDGQAKVTDGKATGNDFTANARGNPMPGGERNFTEESRPQQAPTRGPMPVPVFMQSRPQAAVRAPKARVSPQSIPPDGKIDETPAPAPRAGLDSVAGTARPFRNLRGG
jgi:hypothetical protein